MSLQGQHLEPLAPTSSEFLHYQSTFGAFKLAKLYRIVYQPKGMHRLENFDGYPSIFYHGTGHCGCVLRRGVDTESNRINANDWCGMGNCATQGILNHGHLCIHSRAGKPKDCVIRLGRTFHPIMKLPNSIALDESRVGHFFSPNWSTALGYALQKSQKREYLSMFLVKARFGQNPAPDICAVHGDTDILPCFLAVLRNP